MNVDVAIGAGAHGGWIEPVRCEAGGARAVTHLRTPHHRLALQRAGEQESRSFGAGDIDALAGAIGITDAQCGERTERGMGARLVLRLRPVRLDGLTVGVTVE